MVLVACGLGFAAAFLIQARAAPGEATYFPSGGAYDPHVKVAVLVLGAACVLAARQWPAGRDPIVASVGVVFFLYVTNWQFVVTALAVCFVVNRWARRVPPTVAMIATAATMLGAFVVFVPKTPNPAVNGGLAWAAMRMSYYAFESKAIKRKNRSLWSMLAYAPFTVLLAPGDPPMLSFLTYHSTRPRPFLDALGGRALYRSVLKLHLFLLYTLVLRRHVEAGSDGLHFLAQLVCPYILFYLMLSASADLCTGLSNLAGYYAPDGFDRPFFAMTPIHVWFRWNVHVLGFLRQTVILPIARQRRSLALIVVAGLAASVLLHICARPPVWNNVEWHAVPLAFALNVAFFGAAIPVYQRIDKWPRWAQIVSTVVTQLGLMLMWKYVPGY